MKTSLSISALVLMSVCVTAQSNSYQTIKDTFKGGEDVHAFNVSGFFARTVLWMADEHEFRDAITEVKSIKIITVPKTEFTSRRLSLNGFKKILSADAFQELAHFRDNGDYVTIYLQENGRNNDRYFILVDDRDEIVAVEMKGYIDMNKLMKLKGEVAVSKL